MLLSFKFLIVCTVGVEIFVSEKILFVISVGAVFPSRFFRCTERRGVNHLCWSSDEIDPLVVAYHVAFVFSIFSGRTIFSAFSEHFRFGKLYGISVFYVVPPPLTFLLKTLYCSYVNCKEFHKHERLFMIMVQEVPKR